MELFSRIMAGSSFTTTKAAKYIYQSRMTPGRAISGASGGSLSKLSIPEKGVLSASPSTTLDGSPLLPTSKKCSRSFSRCAWISEYEEVSTGFGKLPGFYFGGWGIKWLLLKFEVINVIKPVTLLVLMYFKIFCNSFCRILSKNSEITQNHNKSIDIIWWDHKIEQKLPKCLFQNACGNFSGCSKFDFLCFTWILVCYASHCVCLKKW